MLSDFCQFNRPAVAQIRGFSTHKKGRFPVFSGDDSPLAWPVFRSRRLQSLRTAWPLLEFYLLGLLCCSLQVFEPLLPRLSSVCLIWLSLVLETKPCFLDCPILLSIYSPQTASIMKFHICRNIFRSYNMKLHLQQLVIKTRISLGPNAVQTSYRTAWLPFFWVNGSLATAAILRGLLPL
jgi:hypothetical protein